jgi:hypothetical protein
MHHRLVRTVLAVLTTAGLLTSAMVSAGYRAPSHASAPASASGQVDFLPSGVFGWD